MALFVITTVLYWPATAFPFVNYDDQLYVYQNPEVLNGFSWSGIQWSLTAAVAGNWHPVTLWSHMGDCTLYHLFAGGHHLTNILLHSINVVLLWLLIMRLTGSFWPAVLVAALFGWHPLNVESVAWIAERKNVLSTFFFFLTLLAYLRYARSLKPAAYMLALFFFALGLAAKPMLVTLPFVLLLLDYWPLQRILPSQEALKDGTNRGNPFLEKIPFFALALADCAITYLTQNKAGAVGSLTAVPITSRLLTVPVAYLMYLEKTIWPANLCVSYGFPRSLPLASVVVGLALLIAGTVAAWHWRSKFRWLPVGWFWFLGTLVPVIGFVQIGLQAWADRYAYLPLIGIFLVIACGLNELWRARQSSHVFIVLAAGVSLCLFLVLTRIQLNYWQSGIVLFSHAIAVDPDNAAAQDLLGTAYNGDGQLTEAIEHFGDAVRLQPQNGEYQYNLGRDLINVGKFSEAEGHLRSALMQMPDDPVLHNTLGVALMQTGQPVDAETEFSRAIALQPAYSKPYLNLGKTLLKEGRVPSAITNLFIAMKLEPDWPEALESLADAYAAGGNFSNAIATANLALGMAQTNRQDSLANQISDELSAYKAKSIPSPPK